MGYIIIKEKKLSQTCALWEVMDQLVLSMFCLLDMIPDGFLV